MPVFATLFGLLLCSQNAYAAADISVAIASNFIAPMKKIVADFQQKTGYSVATTYASSGKLYAQIVNGAPFEVFLSADSEIPVRLENEGYAVPGTRFPYAYGKLILWSPRADHLDQSAEPLRKRSFKRLAIADPKLAPYGRAALETLARLKIYDAVAPMLVVGENVAQAHHFVASGNAELGFIAMSQVMVNGQISGGAWIVPGSLYEPIRQDAVLLKLGRANPGAGAFLAFLKSPSVQAFIQSSGYSLTEAQ